MYFLYSLVYRYSSYAYSISSLKDFACISQKMGENHTRIVEDTIAISPNTPRDNKRSWTLFSIIDVQG
jgi:hypothetical protein